MPLTIVRSHRLTRIEMGTIKETVIEAQKQAAREMHPAPLDSRSPEGARYVWRPPIIEYVAMPPMIVDRVYIEGGKAPVVVRTGYFELIRGESLGEEKAAP